MLLAIGFAVAAEHIRHFQPRTFHGFDRSEVLRSSGRGVNRNRMRQQVEWAGCRTDLAGGDPEIAGGGCEAAVTQQQLDRANIGPGFQQVDRKCVAHRVRADRLAYAGEPAEITAVVRSTGAAPGGQVSVTLMVDGVSAGSRDVTLPPSGWVEVTLPWTAAEGIHAIAVEAVAAGASSGRAEKTVKVGTPVDLAVSICQPTRQDTSAPPQATTPFPIAALAGAPVLGWWLYTGRSRNVALLLTAGMVLAVFAVPVVQASASSQVIAYTLPVEVRNLGGSDAPAFEVTVLLDGERVTQISVAGLPAGGVVREQVTLHTTPGPHMVLVIADEKGVIPEREKGNNRADARYDFP